MTARHEGADVAVARDNAEMARRWNGEEGERWVQYERAFDASSQGYLPALFTAASIDAGERVLDIGCGCGATTCHAARIASAGAVLGVDLSGPMLERARERARAEGLGNVRFEQGDAQVFPFQGEAYDVMISRFGTMFFSDPVAAFTNIVRALRRGGRMAMVCWNDFRKNEWVVAIRHALVAGRTLQPPSPEAPGPFGLSDPTRTRQILHEAGLQDINTEEVTAPFHAGADLDAAYDFVSNLGITKGLLDGVEEDARSLSLNGLRSMLAAHKSDRGVEFGSAAWLVTAQRP